MKQKDMALIGVVVVVSAVISIFISNSVFVPPSNRQQQVQVVEPITTNFTFPDTRYYNSSSFDPANSISINQYNNANPFTENSNGSTNP